MVRPPVLELCSLGLSKNLPSQKGFRPLSKPHTLYFLWRKERSKETSTPSKASPYMGRMQLITGRDRPSSRFWYGSRAFAPLGLTSSTPIATRQCLKASFRHCSRCLRGSPWSLFGPAGYNNLYYANLLWFTKVFLMAVGYHISKRLMFLPVYYMKEKSF